MTSKSNIFPAENDILADTDNFGNYESIMRKGPRKDKVRTALSTTKDAALPILSWVNKSLDVFPRLKTAATAVFLVAETVDVSLWPMPRSRLSDPSLRLCDLIKRVARIGALSCQIDIRIGIFSSTARNVDRIGTRCKRVHFVSGHIVMSALHR